MKSAVPFLREEVIESEAEMLLAEYGREHEAIICPPVPIDEIIELHLKLEFEIRDLRTLFGLGDVHGAIWFRERRIAVDAQLDPGQFPAKRGRYHFTLAHEAGHWRLHRKHFTVPEGQKDLFDGEPKPSYICRSTEKKVPVEWQADCFAACLLMPYRLVRSAWEEWRGGMEPIILTEMPDRRQRLQAELLRRGGSGKSGPDGEGDMILENAIRSFADLFQVSAEAMRIRLEKFGLLARKKEASLFD
jgi:hypothetical protein